MLLLWFSALPPMLMLAALAWLPAARKRNVNIVDSIWSLQFLLAAVMYWLGRDNPASSSTLLLWLVVLWALRLSVHLALRNAGKAEDRRYAAMRAAGPGFTRRSLITVFALQAVLAWFISLPLMVGIGSAVAINGWHWLGLVLFVIGFVFETLGDWQLMRFKADPANQGRVLNSGLWRYTRHPNYFGDALLWWGFACFAFAAGAGWTAVGPALMTFLLLRVSGVRLLERDIEERRPEYRHYVESTSAFIPWFPQDR